MKPIVCLSILLGALGLSCGGAVPSSASGNGMVDRTTQLPVQPPTPAPRACPVAPSGDDRIRLLGETRDWIAEHPERKDCYLGLLSSLDLIWSTPDPGAGPQAEDVSRGFLDLGTVAAVNGDSKVSRAALERAVALSPAGSSAELARRRLADLEIASGNEAAAIANLHAIVKANGATIEPVETLVGLYADDRPGEIDPFCRKLLEKGRARQALACANAAKNNLNDGDAFSVRALAAMPTVTRADVRKVIKFRPSLAEQFLEVRTCGPEPLMDDVEGHSALKPLAGMDAVFARLADSVAYDPDSAECFALASAKVCLDNIEQCTEIGSAARLLELVLGRSDVEKARLYLNLWLNAKNQFYSRDAHTRQGKQALLHMHVALARVMSIKTMSQQLGHVKAGTKCSNIASPTTTCLYTVDYHLKRAEGFWRQLYPDKPTLPQELRENIVR